MIPDKFNVEIVFGEGTENFISKEKLFEEYLDAYKYILNKYEGFIEKGTGEKTNRYHEPTMNFAYNYVKHDDFKKIAREPVRGYTSSGRVKSIPQPYTYYLSVWSIACIIVEKKYNHAFKLKFDHRYRNLKNNDFDGFLVCFKTMNFWKARNLPNNQIYPT